jgi:hypothetical protein
MIHEFLKGFEMKPEYQRAMGIKSRFGDGDGSFWFVFALDFRILFTLL